METARGLGVLAASCAMALAIAGCGGDGDDWEAALAAAQPGDTIVVPAGTHSPGPLQIPPGVTLRAATTGETTLQVEGTGALLSARTDAAGSTPTRVMGLRLRSGADVALLATGDGELIVEDLDIACSRGIGLAAEGLAGLIVRRAAITGDVTSDRVAELVFPASSADAAVIGLALAAVRQSTLEDLAIARFGGFGAVLVDSSTDWTGGQVQDNVGVAVIQHGGRLTLDQVAIRQTVPGQRGSAILAYGLVLAGEAETTTTSLQVEDNSGHGIIQDDASASHEALQLRNNTDVGLWVQHSAGQGDRPALRIAGDSQIAANRGGGLLVVDSGQIEVVDTAITDTADKKVPAKELGLTTMADGLQLAQLQGDLLLRDVRLSDNQRVGLLLSGALPQGARMTLQGVVIDGAGDYGMVAEAGASASADWQVTRSESLAAADEALTAELGAASPMQQLPEVALIREHGIVGDGALLQPGGQGSAGYSVDRYGLTPEND